MKKSIILALSLLLAAPATTLFAEDNADSQSGATTVQEDNDNASRRGKKSVSKNTKKSNSNSRNANKGKNRGGSSKEKKAVHKKSR